MQPLLSFPRSSISRLARPDFDTSGSLSRRMRWTLPQRRRFQPAVLSVPAYRFAQGPLYRAKLNPQFSLALLVVEPRALALLRHQSNGRKADGRWPFVNASPDFIRGCHRVQNRQGHSPSRRRNFGDLLQLLKQIPHRHVPCRGKVAFTATSFLRPSHIASVTSRASTTENVAGGIPGSRRCKKSRITCPEEVGPTSPGPTIQPDRTMKAHMSACFSRNAPTLRSARILLR